MSTPAVGEVVHYRSFGTPGGEFTPECRAAIVTEVPDRTGYADHNDQIVGVAVLNPSGLFFNRVSYDGASDDADRAGGTWHWPEGRTD